MEGYDEVMCGDEIGVPCPYCKDFFDFSGFDPMGEQQHQDVECEKCNKTFRITVQYSRMFMSQEIEQKEVQQ